MNNNIKSVRALGLLSSTSLDGIGIAEIVTDGVDLYELGKSHIAPYDDSLLAQLVAVNGLRPDSPEHAVQIRQAELALTDFCAELAKNYMAESGNKFDIIGFAGHTVCHAPAEHYTHQIGDGQLLANLTGISVAARFRQNDILSGGQGAPISPVYYGALTADYAKPVAVIDIGGNSDVAWFGCNGEMTAFVTGPGNAVINDWTAKHGGMHMDYNGRLAITGNVNEQILKSLMHHKYLLQMPPKACDRNTFKEKLEHLEGLSLADGAATVTAFVAESIAYSMARYLPETPREAIVCGGGAQNPTLMRFLRQKMPEISIKTAREAGWQTEGIDAQAAAFWAVRRLNYLPLTFPGTTGVGEPTIGGEIFVPQK